MPRYLVAAVLSSADAHPSATARFGSAWPGKVAHPVFITNSVCSQDEVIAVSSPSFLTRATSTFCPARQIGTSAAVTAASACLTAIWPAVPLVVQPPQPNPTIIVSTPPMTAPQIPGFNHTGCTIMMSYLLALWRMRSEEHTSELQSLAYLVCRLLLEKKKKIKKKTCTLKKKKNIRPNKL